MRTIYDYINECRSNVENLKGRDAENALRCLDAISSLAMTLVQQEKERDNYIAAINRLGEELLPASCYLQGISENRGRVTNSLFDAPFNAYISISKAGQTLHRLKKELQK